VLFCNYHELWSVISLIHQVQSSAGLLDGLGVSLLTKAQGRKARDVGPADRPWCVRALSVNIFVNDYFGV
jgi:hypothetical protein